MQSVVLHAHCYQPPREDPWLELVEREPSAAPWHDWNTRIDHECYRPMTAARIQAPDGRIRQIVNLFEWISFDVGATLLTWMEGAAPVTLAAILEADAASRTRLGHGNAIAMPYHHVILPLASRRDKVTEVRWGIRDFRRRFGREPEGMWLPETAADLETLDVLAQEGIAFTVVAPHQLATPPLRGLPGSIRTSAGRRLAVFTYEGDIAHDIAFGPLLRDAEIWARRMTLPPDNVAGAKLVSAATDGETFGHHHQFGEMALAAALDRLTITPGLRIENYASFLAANPPLETVELVEPGSWSCPHGVERWRADCGCTTVPETSQAWRAPLRNGLEWLRDRLDHVFEQEGTSLLGDPWAARDRLDAREAADLPVRARELLEMQRHTRRMFTSCGWFFEDVARLESVLVLRSAARAIELAGDQGQELRAGLLTWLDTARSSDPDEGTAAALFTRHATPRWPAAARVAASAAVLYHTAPEHVPPVLGAFEIVEVHAGMVSVRDLRTGDHTIWRTEVHPDSAVRMNVILRQDDRGSDSFSLVLADLPASVRNVVRRRTQARLLEIVLDQQEREDLALGLESYQSVLSRAMLRHLGPEPSRTDAGALEAALDLLSLEGAPVPFEAQTRFHVLRQTADPSARTRLDRLRERFGFAGD